MFSVLPQYADRFGPGAYQVSYDPNSASDSIDDPYPYPPASQQCPSPGEPPLWGRRGPDPEGAELMKVAVEGQCF